MRDAVMVAGPKFAFPAPSVAALQAYLGKPGRLLLLLDPGAPTGLEGILAEQGVVVDADKIFRKVAMLTSGGLTPRGERGNGGDKVFGSPGDTVG